MLVIDGYGDAESVSIYDAAVGRSLVRRARWPIPHSLGHMFGAVSELIGLSMLEAGKTMGLAAYGRASGEAPWPMLAVTGEDFHPPFALATDASDQEITVGWLEHARSLGYKRRVAPDVAQLDADAPAVQLAWSAQAALQEATGMLAARARAMTGHAALCLSGGVALNCSANGLLPEPVYVPPVPHDAGVALGAAWHIAPPRVPGHALDPYLGRAIPAAAIDAALARHGLTAFPSSPDAVAERLLDGQIGAVVTGRAEVGPRALGHRSILAFPHEVGMRDRLNRAKGRELWRPLSPVALPTAAGTYWEPSSLHQYMVGAAQVTARARRDIPAAVHVDGTARPQTIAAADEPVAAILQHMAAAGAAPVLINTSFNRRGEPIVDTPAVDAAHAIGLDFLVLGDRFVGLNAR